MDDDPRQSEQCRGIGHGHRGSLPAGCDARLFERTHPTTTGRQQSDETPSDFVHLLVQPMDGDCQSHVLYRFIPSTLYYDRGLGELSNVRYYHTKNVVIYVGMINTSISCLIFFSLLCYLFIIPLCISIFTGVPPVAVHALNWNPIQISYVMAGYSVAMFLGNLLVVKLSMMGVSGAY